MKFKYFILLIASIVISACSKEIDVENPTFNVTTSANTYRVNDVITFNFEGDPGLLSFYAGTTFNDYQYRTGRVTDAGPVQVSFTSTLAAGTQKNQLAVLLSTDFNGKYDITNVKAATWTDITNRFTLATSTTSTASGKKDITDLIVSKKPFYIAFKYLTQAQASFGTPRQSVIQNYLLETTTTNYGVQTLATQTNSGFQLVTDGTHEVVNGVIPSTIASTIITFNGNTTTGYTEYRTEDWAISQAAIADKVDFGLDKSIPIKGLGDVKVNSYTFTYTTPGTYKATFVAANTNIDNSKKVVKQVELTIIP